MAERLAALEAARGSSAPASSKLVYHQPALAGWRLREAAERGARIVAGELAYDIVWTKTQDDGMMALGHNMVVVRECALV